MKLIIAIVQPHRFPEVKKALYDAEVFKMTVGDNLGCGQQKGYPKGYVGKIEEINLLKKVRIEVAVNEDYVDETINAIIKGARTGKKEVRLARTFIDFIHDEEVIMKIIENTFTFIDRYIDRSLEKEHFGYIVDREGFAKYKDAVLKDVPLNKEAVVYD